MGMIINRGGEPKITPEQGFIQANRLTMRLTREFSRPEIRIELALRLRDALRHLKEVSERHAAEEFKGLQRLESAVASVLDRYPDATRDKHILGRTPEEKKVMHDATMLASRSERLLFYLDNL